MHPGKQCALEQRQPASEDTVLGLIVRLFCSPDDFWNDELNVDDPLAI
jgi:hypothetical protein